MSVRYFTLCKCCNVYVVITCLFCKGCYNIMSVVTVCYVIYYVNVIFNFVTVSCVNVKVCSVLLVLQSSILCYVLCLCCYVHIK